MLDFSRDVVSYIEGTEKLYSYFDSGGINNSSLPNPLDRQVSLEELPNKEVLRQIPNLCVNLINYINAHNVTLIQKERKVIELQRDERNKKKRKESQQPFYLVVVKDKIRKETDEPKEKGLWTLTERIYVRGHVVRFRNKDFFKRLYSTPVEELKETGYKIDQEGFVCGWTPSYIKGPPLAPFKDQRHVVLAEKLLREKEMMRKYDVGE